METQEGAAAKGGSADEEGDGKGSAGAGAGSGAGSGGDGDDKDAKSKSRTGPLVPDDSSGKTCAEKKFEFSSLKNTFSLHVRR